MQRYTTGEFNDKTEPVSLNCPCKLPYFELVLLRVPYTRVHECLYRSRNRCLLTQLLRFFTFYMTTLQHAPCCVCVICQFYSLILLEHGSCISNEELGQSESGSLGEWRGTEKPYNPLQGKVPPVGSTYNNINNIFNTT